MRILLLCGALAALVTSWALMAEDRSAQCATCHPAQGRNWKANPMGHALIPMNSVPQLATKPEWTATIDGFQYTIRRDGDGYTYIVSDGRQELRKPILWAVGFGVEGQTYILEHEGQIIESHASYFTRSNALGLTIGQDHDKPRTVIEALGRPQTANDVRACFSCHGTQKGLARKFDLATIDPGVSCEHCHGALEPHLAAVKAGDQQHLAIKSLKTKLAESNIEFCAQCHRSFEDVVRLNLPPINTVRFQPYRLIKSKCYDGADARIACVACHDPHQPVARGAASHYDAACLKCHVTSKTQVAQAATPRICPIGKVNCASCHMLQYEFPGAQAKFTDHYIRIGKPGAPVPE